MNVVGGDYGQFDQTVTFSQTSERFFIPVNIVDDAILENTESFLVQAELVSNDAPGVTIDPSETTVTIEDNDGKHNLKACSYIFIIGSFSSLQRSPLVSCQMQSLHLKVMVHSTSQCQFSLENWQPKWWWSFTQEMQML